MEKAPSEMKEPPKEEVKSKKSSVMAKSQKS